MEFINGMTSVAAVLSDPDVVDFFREVGELTGDASVGRGIVTCVGVIAVVLTTGWKLIRRRPDRIRHSFDAPAGTVAKFEYGDKNNHNGGI